MQIIALAPVAVLVFVVLLVMALAILASPILAAVVFVFAFAGFLLWRGRRRAQEEQGQRGPGGVTSEEATADPVEDSGTALVSESRRP